MIPLTLDELAAVTGGRVVDGDGDLVVSGPAFLDSRSPEHGGLFVAFAGEHVDGHEFAAGAVAGGAAAALGSRATGVPTVVVTDAQASLQALARDRLTARRAQAAAGGSTALDVVALTGSQGKTSTKDLLDHVLRTHGETVATRGSFNNELGLPLTVLRATAETRHLVLEMGARGIGHLADLCRIAPPDVSLVLNVGTAHLGEFGSREAIAQAKGEIVEALAAGGVAVLNADDPRVAAMATRTQARVLTFGAAPGADVRVEDLTEDELGRPSFALVHDGVTERVDLQLLGRHHALNAAAVAATALALDVPLTATAAALRHARSTSPWRMELTEREDGLRVVNDAYNANPESTRAALEWLAGVGRRTGARTVAVLGEMRELGGSAAEAHREVGRLVADLGIDGLVVVGAAGDPAADALEEGARSADGWSAPLRAVDVREAVDLLRETVRGPDVVLVKASRGVALERVAAGLLEPTDHRPNQEDHR